MNSELNGFFEDCLEVRDGFSRVDWEGLSHYTHKLGDSDELWSEIARLWVSQLVSEVKDDCVQFESSNFLLVSSGSISESENTSILSFLEMARRQILSTLSGIASDEGYGKHVVLIFADSDEYYRYISDFYQESATMTYSAGVYLNRGYGHFAMTYLDMNEAEATLGHELTHALLSHLPIPTWVDEGLAVGMENLLSHSVYTSMDADMESQHQKFWNASRFKEFYSGESFSSAGKGQELSYHLGEFAVNTLSKDYESFTEFANLANFNDGGESAAKEVYGNGLDDLITGLFLNEGADVTKINSQLDVANKKMIFTSLAILVFLVLIMASLVLMNN